MNYAGSFEFSHFGTDAPTGADAGVDVKSHLQAHENDAHVITVPDAYLLFSGDYKRAGLDLVLSKDGHDHVVHDYFRGHSRATLASPDGAHLTGDLVNALTGEVQIAQAGGAAAAATVIGHVTKLTGSATAIRNGVSIQLNVGDNVNKGDVVQAGAESSLGLTFIDGTVFGLSSNARMVLNEMVYDPNGTSNSSLLSLVQGTITFVAGETAKHGDMKVDTPVATMGIRGTAVLVEIDFSVPGQGGAPPVKFSVLVEPGGHVGSYFLYSKTDPNQIIGQVNQSGQVTSIDGAGDTTTTQAPPLTPIAQAIIQQTLQEYFPNYVPGFNPRGTAPLGGSTPPDPVPGSTNPDPLKFQIPDFQIGVPTVIPINLPGAAPTAPPIDVTITRLNSAPTITVAPVVVTLPVNKTSFDIQDQVKIIDADSGDAAVPYVQNSAHIISATGPANTPVGIDLKSLIIVDPATGHVSYDSTAFKFLGAGQTAVYTIGFDSQSGPDTVHETLTFTVDGVNDTPVLAAPLVTTTHQGDTVVTADLLAGASDPDAGETATLSITNVHYVVDGGAASLTSPAGVALAGTTLTIDPKNAAFTHLALGQTETIQVTYDVTDAHGATVTQTETVTVTGTNDAPVAGPALTSTTQQDDAAYTVNLLAGASDPDDGETATLSVTGVSYSIDGGTASQTAPAGISLTSGILSVDPTNSSFAHLAQDQTETVTVTYGVTDAHGATVTQTETVTVTGTNDAPVAGPALTSTTQQDDAAYTVNLLAGASDPDDGETATLSVTGVSYSIDGGTASQTAPAGISLTSGILSVDPTNSSFAHLAQGQTETVTVTYGVTDAHGATVAQSEAVTIAGINDAPKFIAGAAYMTGITDPWNVSPGDPGSPDAAMNTVFGSGNWTKFQGFTTAALGSSYHFLFIDGGDGTSDAFNSFISSNITALETFVAQGGDLFIDAARWTGTDLNVGFGITLHYGNYFSFTGTAIDSSNPIFNGPIGSAGTSWYGNYFSHDTVTGNAITPLIMGTSGVVLAEEAWGSGEVYVGGITSPYFQSPQPQADILLANIIANASQAGSGLGSTGAAVTEGSGVGGIDRAQGSLAFTDADDGDTHTVATQFSSNSYTGGQLGMLTAVLNQDTSSNSFGTLTWTYQVDDTAIKFLAAGQTIQETFNVVVTDNHGASDTISVVATIVGTNDAPTITATTPVDLVEATSTGPGVASSVATLTLADVDGTANYDTAALTAAGWNLNLDGTYSKAGTYGTATLDISANTVTYALDNTLADPLTPTDHPTETFSIPVTDGTITAATNVTFRIDGANDAPTVTATTPVDLVEATSSDPGTAASVATLTLNDVDGTASYDTAALASGGWALNPDGTYSKAGTYGIATLNTATNTVTYNLNTTLADGLTSSDHPTETFTIPVTDGAATASATVTFTIDGRDNTPMPATTVWTGAAGDGNWTNAANWTPHAPTSIDTASFSANTSVTIGSDIEIAGLIVTAGVVIDVLTNGTAHAIDVTGTLNNNGDIVLHDGATLEVTGTIENNGTITIDTPHPVGATLVIDGAVTFEGGGIVTLDGTADRIVEHGHGASLENVDNKIDGYGTIGDGHLSLVNDAGGIIAATNLLHGLTIDAGSFINDGQIVSASLFGGLEITGNLVNNGTIEAHLGVLKIDGNVTGHGDAVIDGGALEFGGASDAHVQFTGSTADALVLDRGSHFTGTVTGFSLGDTIDLEGISSRNIQLHTHSDGTTTVDYGSGSFTIDGDYSRSGFVVTSDLHGGTAIVWTDPAPQISTSDLELSQHGNKTTIHGLSFDDANAGRNETFTLTTDTDDGHVDITDDAGHLSDLNHDLAHGITYHAGEGSTGMVSVTVADHLGASDSVNFIFSTDPCPATPVALNGTAGKDVIFATTQTDVMSGGASADQFVFATSAGNHTITDFTPGQDKIELDFAPANTHAFQQWLSHAAAQQGPDTLINLDSHGDTLLLKHVAVADLHASDFIVQASQHAA